MHAASCWPARPHTLVITPSRPDHVCLVCQLEFTSRPIRPSAGFEWTIGKVIDRGYPKLCFPTSLDPLDPVMREQCRVTVPGLRQARADKLHVRAAAHPVRCTTAASHVLRTLVAPCRP